MNYEYLDNFFHEETKNIFGFNPKVGNMLFFLERDNVSQDSQKHIQYNRWLQLSRFSLLHNCIMERCNVYYFLMMETGLEYYITTSNKLYLNMVSDISMQCMKSKCFLVLSDGKLKNLQIFETMINRKRCETFNAIKAGVRKLTLQIC